MAEKEFDPFAPSTGLADDFDAEIVGAEFGYRSSYKDGEQVLLILTLKSTDGTTFKDAEEETESLYSCGGAWEATEKGKRVQREDGKRMGFNNKSAVWAVIEAFMNVDGGALRATGDPMAAASYAGLGTFHWKRVTYKDLDGKDKERLLPVKMLVAGGAKKVTKKATKETPAPTPEEPVAAEPEDTEAAAAPDTPVARATAAIEGLSAAESAKLLMLAKKVRGEGGDHEKFVETVFETIDGAAESMAITNAVLAGEENPAGIWARSAG
jgi:hypothetical protein